MCGRNIGILTLILLCSITCLPFRSQSQQWVTCTQVYSLCFTLKETKTTINGNYTDPLPYIDITFTFTLELLNIDTYYFILIF